MARLYKIGHRRLSPRKILDIPISSMGLSSILSNTKILGGPGDQDFPNEPVGLTRICEHNFNVMPGLVGGGTIHYGVTSNNVPAGSWWNTGSSNLSIVTDPTGDKFTNSFLRIKYPIGQVVGESPGYFVGWGPSDTGGDGYNQQGTLYISQRFRMIGPPGSENTWEMNATGTKLNYTPHAYLTSLAMSFTMLRPSPGIPTDELGIRSLLRIVNFQKWVRVDSSSPTGCTYPWVSSAERSANVSGASSTKNVGDWIHMEQLFEINPAECPPPQTGRWRIWLDNVLTFDYQNWGFRTTAPNNAGFHQYRPAPVYGGTLGPNKTREDFLDFAHARVSGIPL